MTTATSEEFEYWNTGSEAYKRLLATKELLGKSGLEARLLELVFLRVSQINGCTFCISLHRATARRAGATTNEIRNLAEWHRHETFGEPERAVLAWAEAVTLLSNEKKTAAAKSQLMSILTPGQLVDLTVAVALMNALNRIAISFGRKT